MARKGFVLSSVVTTFESGNPKIEHRIIGISPNEGTALQRKDDLEKRQKDIDDMRKVLTDAYYKALREYKRDHPLPPNPTTDQRNELDLRSCEYANARTRDWALASGLPEDFYNLADPQAEPVDIAYSVTSTNYL